MYNRFMRAWIFVTWALSWVLPACTVEIGYKGRYNTDTVLGFEAAYMVLIAFEQSWPLSLWWFAANPLFLFGLFLAPRHPRNAAITATLASGSAGMWLLDPKGLLIGYWLWFGSTVVLAVYCWWPQGRPARSNPGTDGS